MTPELLFESLARTTDHIVWRADDAGAVTSIHAENPAQFWPWLGAGWRDAIHPQDRQRVTAAWAEAGLSGAPLTLEWRIEVNGRHRWFRVRGTPVPDAEGRRHWVGICTDIQDGVTAREQLVESELSYRALIEATAALVWRADPQGMVTDGRGWDLYSSVRGDSWLDVVHPDEQLAMAEQWRRIVASGVTGELEFRARTDAGEYRWCVSRCVPIKSPEGEVREWIGTLTDVHDRHVAAEALNRSERLKAIGRLTAGIGHDFNNLLTVVISGAEALADQLAPGTALEEQAKLTLHAAERGAGLIRRLLAFAKQQPLRPTSLNLNDLVASLEPLARRTIGAEVDVVFSSPAKPIHCTVDPAQLESALINLCINAQDAMPDGGRLTVAVEHVQLGPVLARRYGVKPGGYAAISVSDTGTGMSPEVLEHAIEPFFTTKKAGYGSGLGLSMVYGFVKQSGGHLVISSAEGAGTVVRLLLPKAEAADAVAAPARPIMGPNGAHVLLVEDDELVRRQVRRQLQGLGHQVTATSNANTALQALRAEGGRFQLLMTDIMMPGGMNGRQLAVAARALHPDLPILLTSGYADQGALGIDQGCGAHFLQKPYRRAALAEAVAAVLGLAGQGAAADPPPAALTA